MELSEGNGGVLCIMIAFEMAPAGLRAMYALNFTIAFAFEIKLTGGSNHIGEIIVVTSDCCPIHLACPSWDFAAASFFGTSCLCHNGSTVMASAECGDHAHARSLLKKKVSHM